MAEVAQPMAEQSPRYVLGVADQVPDGLRSRIARVAEIVTEMGVY